MIYYHDLNPNQLIQLLIRIFSNTENKNTSYLEILKFVSALSVILS